MSVFKYPDIVYLTYLLERIETLTDDSYVNYRNSQDYAELSKLIEIKTKKKVSPSSLKKIWNSPENFLGRDNEIIDILSIFLDYKDWIDFKVSNDDNYDLQIVNKKIISKNLKGDEKQSALYFITFFLLVIGGIFFLFYNSKTKNISKDYTFECLNPQGKVPLSVKFKYDFSNFKTDSIYIIAGDNSRPHPVDIDSKFMSRIYFLPGYKKAKLIINNDVIQEIDIFAYTESWIALYRDKLNEGHPYYFYIDDLISESGLLGLKKSTIEKNSIPIISNMNTNYFFVRKFGLDGDNLKIELALRNRISNGADACQKTNVGLMFSNGFATIPILNPACISLGKIYYSDIYINGWTNDLSQFSVDLNKWQKLSVESKNKEVEIQVSDNEKYIVNYSKSLGDFVGFRIEFQGLGEIDYVEIFNSDNQVIYSNNFGEVLSNK